ncbi:MAG TPA: alpha/beta hydrolase, partial [Pirellulales bacterium]
MTAPTGLLTMVAIVLPVMLGSTKAVIAVEPETMALWPNDAPDAKGTTDNDKPTLTIYPAPDEKAMGTGVVVCPGG